jgi:hypothetical protein
MVYFESGRQEPEPVAQHVAGQSRDRVRSTGKAYPEKDNRALWNSCEPVNNFSNHLDTQPAGEEVKMSVAGFTD